MARRRPGKIIEKVEIRADGRIFTGRIRMITDSRFATTFCGECDDPELVTEQKPSVDEVRTELKNAIRSKAAPGKWKKYVMVHFDFDNRDYNERDRHFGSYAETAEAGLKLSWSYLWLGQYADGSPCYKYRENDSARPGDHKGAGRIVLGDNETSVRLEWTPQIEEGLCRVKKGIVHLSKILRDLLGKKRIVQTLTNIPEPILRALPGPRTGGKEKDG